MTLMWNVDENGVDVRTSGGWVHQGAGGRGACMGQRMSQKGVRKGGSGERNGALSPAGHQRIK